MATSLSGLQGSSIKSIYSDFGLITLATTETFVFNQQQQLQDYALRPPPPPPKSRVGAQGPEERAGSIFTTVGVGLDGLTDDMQALTEWEPELAARRVTV